MDEVQFDRDMVNDTMKITLTCRFTNWRASSTDMSWMRRGVMILEECPRDEFAMLEEFQEFIREVSL